MLAKEREMRDDQLGWIFPSPKPKLSKTGHRNRMRKPFERSVARAGLDPKRITPHVMRHTAITNLVQAGVDLPTIQKISGHKTLAMVMRYTHVHGAHINAAMKALGRTTIERSANETTETVTPKLHMFPKARV